MGLGEEGQGLSWPPAVAVIGRLVGLGLLRNGAGLTVLSTAHLAILLQMMVKDLGAQLLMVVVGGRQIAHKGGSCDRTDAPPPLPRSEGQLKEAAGELNKNLVSQRTAGFCSTQSPRYLARPLLEVTDTPMLYP